jgi:hypothetical protein
MFWSGLLFYVGYLPSKSKAIIEPQKVKFTLFQGDHIGRIFAYWVIVYFGQWFKNYRGSANFWVTFSTVPVMN